MGRPSPQEPDGFSRLLSVREVIIGWCLGFGPFLLALGTLILMQWQFRWVPPYWDGIFQYYPALEMYHNHLRPWIVAGDTGHPFLLPWTMAVLIKTGLNPIMAMHLTMWLYTSILIFATWRLGVVVAGKLVGVLAAFLIILSPPVFAQALQFAGDIPMAAFFILALALFLEGRYFSAGLSASLMAMCKLNGIFGIAPIVAGSLYLIFVNKLWLDGQRLFHLASATVVPVLLFLIYHLLKYQAIGRFFDSGEWLDGGQLAMATSLGAYLNRLGLAFYSLLHGTGMAMIASVLVVALPFAIIKEIRRDRSDDRPGGSESGSKGEVFIAVFLLGAVILQLALQSIRDFGPLPRYFIVCYPPLLVLALALLRKAAFPFHGRWLLGCTLLCVFYFLLLLFPNHTNRIPATVQASLHQQHTHVNVNFENNMGFVSFLHSLSKAVNWLDDHVDPSTPMGASGWISLYVTHPEFGFAETMREELRSLGSFSEQDANELHWYITYELGMSPRLPETLYNTFENFRLVKEWNTDVSAVGIYRAEPISQVDGE